MAKSETNTKQWPSGVHSITWNEIGKLGFHDVTGTMYWDGKEVVTRSVVRLGSFELFLAMVATVSLAGMLVLDLARAFQWWGLGALAAS